MINGLIAGGLGLIGAPLGVVVGWVLSRRQQRAMDEREDRRRLREQMQQLVVAASELMVARKTHHARWLSRESRVRLVGMAGIEFWSAWRSGAGSRAGAARGLGAVARMVNEWDRSGLQGAAALAPYLAGVAAAGLPLGMSDDPAVAAAAQAVMSAALEDKGEAALNEGIAALRAALYPPQVDRRRWYARVLRRRQAAVTPAQRGELPAGGGRSPGSP